MKVKELYLSPQCEVIEVKTEGVVCASGDLQDNKYEYETW